MKLRIRQGYELLDARGSRLAGPGEIVDREHPACALADMATIAVPVEDEPAPVVEAAPAPEVRDVVAPRRTFGRRDTNEGLSES